ncbi:MAG TPA: NAD(P)/FAD-dependent oxidoreductase [Cyclobacteriaceae bacterium]|nr:NAD(P)/FAD-dependent oxidoreductase [Cyclobacteriaceae bacterium]HMV07773.1 NAD(P)/FAD-dependent oxidoreductase [Cyclobacteriaceae bacterium]HMV88041.1 NAD(P)/FAD-dependent oxidoreductase [Cyclobacteriaceae bacterium]HMW98908.1 NAD(P)/FAD-dependent oxidoreductase [Cyclobacteriaceae bacterium]HMX48459.1 NAD(P)/FAD-dependent oxidoreductase [Cyclobacteriaceae bacterium]
MPFLGVFDLIIIGGGAAGFFGAIQAAEMRPDLKILILEKSNKLLSKVRISGGGRCNVTHNCFEPTELSHHYPRGQKVLKSLFRKYQATDVVRWFEQQGVKLKAEADGRMFPVTDNSATIIDCFLREAKKHQIKIELNAGVTEIKITSTGFSIFCDDKKFAGKKVLVAIGGHPNASAYSFLRSMGHSTLPLIPSLFTLNDSQKQFKDLMGVSVSKGVVRIAGAKFFQEGPILITHWGLSGPAVIKLSAWAAEYFYQHRYEATVLVGWIPETREEVVRQFLIDYKSKNGKRKIYSYPLYELPQRLWVRLCELAEIDPEKIWGELANKNLNKLLELLIRCPFQIKGKTTFKEEFVTCGGVDLHEIDLDTMESKKVKNLFFAGEVLNIDGETGGFNFQAAWTTSYVAAKQIASA